MKGEYFAHEHGAADLNLFFEGKMIQIELLLPAVDILKLGIGRDERVFIERSRSIRIILNITDSRKIEHFPSRLEDLLELR